MIRFELKENSKNCPICKSGRLKKFEAHAHDAPPPTKVHIKECKTCHFAWQFPRGRSAEDSTEWFEAAYSDKRNANSEYFDDKRKQEISLLEVDFINSLTVDDMTILDIGAGAGTFAKSADRSGWSVTALDPALDKRQFEGNSRISAIRGSLDEIPKNRFFDVITLWDVIEHVEAPITLVNDAKERLKPGGWLVIETGNYKSVNRINAGVRHWIYQLDHRWYFSPDSTRHILQECGFTEFQLADRALRPGWHGDTSYQGPSRAHLLRDIIKKPHRIPSLLIKNHHLNIAKSWQHAGIGIFTIAAQNK